MLYCEQCNRSFPQVSMLGFSTDQLFCQSCGGILIDLDSTGEPNTCPICGEPLNAITLACQNCATDVEQVHQSVNLHTTPSTTLPSRPSRASKTEGRKAALLCYVGLGLHLLTLIGIIASTVCLLRKQYRRNSFVRFHAIQSLLLNILGIGIVSGIAAIEAEKNVPEYKILNLIIPIIILLILTGFIMMYQVNRNAMAKFPLIGSIAMAWSGSRNIANRPDLSANRATHVRLSGRRLMTRLGILGAFVGALIGFLSRPSSPIFGQLDFGTIITRGSLLRGADELLVPLAETSFNHLLIGAILGVVIGVGSGYLASRRKGIPGRQASIKSWAAQESAELKNARSGDEIAEKIKKLAKLRDKGILTDEEFQAKKIELLNRL